MCRWARLGRERRHCIIRLVAARVVYRDRRGRPGAIVEWQDDGRLAAAGVRTPVAGWILIEPRAGVVDPWGEVDRLWRRDSEPADALLPGDEAALLSVATATEWTRPTTIPVVSEPARLPAGAGTAVLNLVALLARERGVARVAYEGPYPTEALFLSLLESFDPDVTDGDPLARFMAGELGWVPAPFEPCFDEDIYVQRRARIEKVVWRERTYWRERWGNVRRWAPLRVDDDGGSTRCALWALGRVLEEHVRVDVDGRPMPASRSPGARSMGNRGPRTSGGVLSTERPVATAIREGVVSLIVAKSAPPLAQALHDEAATLAWTVGHVDRDLVQVDGAHARIAATFARAVREAFADSGTRTPQAALGVLAEIASAFGDALRARAQARLAASPEEVQRRALAKEAVDAPGTAARITAAVKALLASGRVEDEPDVERDEGGDRDH